MGKMRPHKHYTLVRTPSKNATMDKMPPVLGHIVRIVIFRGGIWLVALCPGVIYSWILDKSCTLFVACQCQHGLLG